MTSSTGIDTERFGFGANWARYLAHIDSGRIATAEKSLQTWFARSDFAGLSFLDAGCGSGLFSLAARRLGASVTSFDFDRDSVGCAQELRRVHSADESRWTISQGSVLDRSFLESLGKFDLVYCWGVLHHTGSMWQGMAEVAELVRPGGELLVAIYNDQGWKSRYWTLIKRWYNRGLLRRAAIVALHAPAFYVARLGGNVRHALRGTRRQTRGMAFWTDLLDWLGGYPFEVASSRQIQQFMQERGCTLVRERSVESRGGCNELVFRRNL